MAQFAANLGLPWRPVAQTIALRVVPTNLDIKAYKTIYIHKNLKNKQ